MKMEHFTEITHSNLERACSPITGDIISKDNEWPHWFPKSSRIAIKLTKEQRDYILPVFNTCRGDASRFRLDGVSLCGGTISGIRVSISGFLRRFDYSDIDVSNIERAIK